MKIVDLRPMMVKRFTRTDKSPSPMSMAGRLAGFVADGIISRRVAQRPQAADHPVLVSIGNLALGGTGKTPVVMAMAKDLSATGVMGAVLTRGYGSPLSGPLVVDADNISAGDEARMMAQRINALGWFVVQSRNRPEGLEYLKENHPGVQVVLLEDAFQTKALARHEDIVILDSWDVLDRGENSLLKPVTGSVFPFGPWRESARGAERATALLVECDNEVPEKSNTGQPVFSFSRYVELRQVHGPETCIEENSWALVSGIARPEKVEESAEKLLEKPAVLSLRYRDHMKYPAKVVLDIQKKMTEAGATALITTAKDWVKLSSVWNDARPVMVLEMNLEWGTKNAFNQWLVERVLKKAAD